MGTNSFISYQSDGVYIAERQGIHLHQLGGLHLYTPRTSEEVRFRMILESVLRRVAEPGIYTGNKANEIVKVVYAGAEAELKRLLPQVASRSFFEFLVFMHSQWGQLMIKAHQGLLDTGDTDEWWRDGPTARRTLRYLLEESVRLSPPERPLASENSLLTLLDRVYIAARHLVTLSNISDQLYFFYPSDAQLIVFPPRQEKYFEYKLQPAPASAFARFENMKIEHHTSSGEELEDFPSVWNLIKERLNGAFQSELGISVEKAIGFCYRIKEFVRPAEKSFGVLFVLEEKLYDGIAKNFSLSGTAIRRVLAGLTLTTESLKAENRQLFESKRIFQSRYRPFVRLPHATGPHLAWHTYTLESTLPDVIGNLIFGKIPPEWNYPKISAAIQEVNQTLATRFVYKVRDRFNACGWKCVTEVRELVDSQDIRHSIVNDPGEIDVLTVSPDGKIIGQVECKRLNASDDTRTYRDDLSDFYGNGQFLAKAKRKHSWLMKHRSVLIAHLSRSIGVHVDKTVRICPLFLTLFPNFAATRAAEVPIRTAKIFFRELTNNAFFWSDGKHSLS